MSHTFSYLKLRATAISNLQDQHLEIDLHNPSDSIRDQMYDTVPEVIYTLDAYKVCLDIQLYRMVDDREIQELVGSFEGFENADACVTHEANVVIRLAYQRIIDKLIVDIEKAVKTLEVFDVDGKVANEDSVTITVDKGAPEGAELLNTKDSIYYNKDTCTLFALVPVGGDKDELQVSMKMDDDD